MHADGSRSQTEYAVSFDCSAQDAKAIVISPLTWICAITAPRGRPNASFKKSDGLSQ